MSAASFLVTDPVEHHDALLTLNIEYMGWVFQEIERTFGRSAHDLIGMSVPEYVAGNFLKVCGERPPQGIFYLIEAEDNIAGMCGLRFLRPGLAEIKRLYVRPAYRGRKLGQLALERLLADASRFGYERVCLDTGPFMGAAHRLYEAQGFVDCAAYEGVEVPAEFHHCWRFMERAVPPFPLIEKTTARTLPNESASSP